MKIHLFVRMSVYLSESPSVRPSVGDRASLNKVRTADVHYVRTYIAVSIAKGARFFHLLLCPSVWMAGSLLYQQILSMIRSIYPEHTRLKKEEDGGEGKTL